MNFKTTVLSAALALGVFVSNATAPAGGFTSPDSIRTQILDKLNDIPNDKWMEVKAQICFTVDEAGTVDVVDVQTENDQLRDCILKQLDASQLAIPYQQASKDYWITVTFRVI